MNGSDIWVGTDKGVAEITDDKHTRNFDDTNGLRSNEIYSICYDSARKLMWFASQGSLSGFNGSTWTYQDSISDGLPNRIIRSIITSPDTLLWIAPDSLPPYAYAHDEKVKRIWMKKDEGLEPNTYVFFLKTFSNILYAGTDKGLYKWDGAKWTNVDPSIPNNRVSSMAFINGNLWIGSDGDYIYQKTSSSWKHYSLSEIAFNLITCLLVDSKGRYWVGGGLKPGTKGSPGIGLCMYENDTWRYINKKDGLTDSLIISIGEDETGHIWATQNRSFMSVLQSDGSIDPYWKSYSWSKQSAWTGKDWTLTGVQRGNTGEMFVTAYGWDIGGARGGLFKWDMAKKTWTQIGSDIDYAKIVTYKRSPWAYHFCSIYNTYMQVYDGKSWTKYDNNDGFLSTDISDFAFEGSTAWITTGGGLARFINGSVTLYSVANVPDLISDNFSSICIDWNGTKWLGTKFSGIAKLSSDSTWSTMQIGNMANSPYIYQIMPYRDKSKIVFATGNGLWIYEVSSEPPSDLSELACYPNPLYYSSKNRNVYFDKVSQNARLYIWSSSGRKIVPETNTFLSDHKTYILSWVVPENIRSGIYFFIIEQNGERKKGKVAIIKR